MVKLVNGTERASATIANGAAVSGSVDIGSVRPRGLAVEVPSAWTAADIAFEVSANGSTWVKLRDKNGSRVKITGVVTNAAGVYAAPSEAWVAGAYPFLRVVSINTGTEADENQGAERVLSVVMLS